MIRTAPTSRLLSRSCLLCAGFALLACEGSDPEGAGGALTPTGGSDGSGTAGSNAMAGSSAAAGSSAGGAGGTDSQGAAGSEGPNVGIAGQLNQAGTDNGGGNNGGAAGATSEPDAGAPPDDTVAAVPVFLPDCTELDNPAVPNIGLQEIASGLNQPTLVVEEPLAQGATEVAAEQRLYVVEQSGTVRLIVDDVLQAQPFLDIGGRVDFGGEQGFLGLAFHPDFQSNGKFYVNYSAQNVPGTSNGDTVVSEFTVGANPNQVDAQSERIVLTVGQPAANHNGGNLQFGPDGMLFIGMGDGGNGNDQFGPIGNGQNLNALLGKMLRIDVNSGDEDYLIPDDNPFVGQDGDDEIWSYGLRNPWRFSFDQCTGDMYIGDVGQGAQEEIDFEPAGAAGRNYGWRCREGNQNTANTCNGVDTSQFVDPIATYGRGVGQSITGGYVYRGSAIPELRGTYLYADYQTAEFFALRVENGQLVPQSTVNITDNINSNGVTGISSFGQDNAGEMYVVSLGQVNGFNVQPNSGAIFRIVAE